MKSKKTFIKYIIVLAIVILALCIGKTVSFAEIKLKLDGSTKFETMDSMDTPPSEIEGFKFNRPGENGGDPTSVVGNKGRYPFLCRQEYTGWSFYVHSETIEFTDDQVLKYEKKYGPVNIETSIAFGLLTANEIGQYNTQTLQHLVWGSSRYAGQNGYINTVEEGDSSWYELGDTIIQRAKQYGDFYYGVLNGQDKSISLNLKKDKAKVYIDQSNKEIIAGPYQLSINNLPNNKFTDDGKTSLYNELTGVNKQNYPNAPTFASFEIKDITQNNCTIELVDKDGIQCIGNFPNWDEDFYFKYTNVSSNISEVNPQISINHIKSIGGEAYYYESQESDSEITRKYNIR